MGRRGVSSKNCSTHCYFTVLFFFLYLFISFFSHLVFFIVPPLSKFSFLVLVICWASLNEQVEKKKEKKKIRNNEKTGASSFLYTLLDRAVTRSLSSFFLSSEKKR